jgi:hypothetical protein
MRRARLSLDDPTNSTLPAVNKQEHRRVKILLCRLDDDTLQILMEKGVSETIEWIWSKYQEEKQIREKLQNLCKMLESENRKVWELNNKINGGNGKKP